MLDILVTFLKQNLGNDHTEIYLIIKRFTMINERISL